MKDRDLAEGEQWLDNPLEGTEEFRKASDYGSPAWRERYDREKAALKPRFVTKAEEEEYDRKKATNVKASNPKDSIGIAKAYASTLPRPVLWEVGLGMLEGALKYGRHNYRAIGVRSSVYYDAIARHLDAWWEGQDIDPASGIHHISKAIAGLVVLRDAQMQDKCEDDRPPPSPEGWLEELNVKAKALLDKYPEEQRKEPYTIKRRF